MDLAAGSIVADRYRLDRQIGAGGMGTVWAATHTITGKAVALKVLRATARDASPAAWRRLLREARAASAVDHPNVIQIIDAFEIDGQSPVLVMDLLEGERLRDRLRRSEGISLDETVMLLGPIITAVAAAHDAGIIHRDLKPENIFLAAASGGEATAVRPVVVDFGVAKLFERERSGKTTLVTMPGTTLGTPAYMAPEQCRGQADIDSRVDVWSLGVILYECLAGVRPIEGDSTTEIVEHLLTQAITPIEALEPDLPDAVTDVVGRMLSRDREGRPGSLHEVAKLLQASAASAPRESPTALAPTPVAAKAAPSLSRRALVAIFALVALSLVVAGAAGTYLWITRESAESADPGQSAKRSGPKPSAADELETLNVARGRPSALEPGKSSAFWVWRGRQGRWVLAVTSASGREHTFQGRVEAVDGKRPAAAAQLGALRDQLAEVEAGWTFSYATDAELSAVTFEPSPGGGKGCLRFDLELDGSAKPAAIHIGRAARHPPASRFVLCPMGKR